MKKSSSKEAVAQRIGWELGLNRGLVLGVGAACVVLGAVAILLPSRLFGSLVWAVGLVLLGSGGIKAAQFLLGRDSATLRRRGWPMIAAQVALDVVMGMLLLTYRQQSIGVVTFALGLLFAVEGSLMLVMGLRTPTTRGRALLWINAAVSIGIAVVILLRLVDNPINWAGVFVGIKLLLFGATLLMIAARSPLPDDSLVYETALLNPEVAELYAVYFGTAFHLGVYVGDGMVVHYLDDNHVYHVTWEQFLEGRIPHHWTYPDLPEVPTETVVMTALSEVGKTYPYNLLTFNCEHFAIFCKSGGLTKTSKYAQIPAIAANVQRHPFLGMVAELNTRIVEWLAFQLGGPSGQRLSLAVRRIGSAVTAWLMTRGGLVDREETATTSSPTRSNASG
jgi:uncharacterized membrane protein HdeD (DUF308 family)